MQIQPEKDKVYIVDRGDGKHELFVPTHKGYWLMILDDHIGDVPFLDAHMFQYLNERRKRDGYQIIIEDTISNALTSMKFERLKKKAV